MGFHTPTLQLLTASILVAISGAFRVHIAFLFLDIAPDMIIYFAGFLVIYATYTLDRTHGCEEDKINKKELTAARKDIAIVFCLVSLIIGSFLFYMEGLPFIGFIPFVIGYIYSKGIRIGSFLLKFKGNFGVKNLAVSLTWGLIITGITQRWAGIARTLSFIFPFFTVKSFINTVIYDFRDVKGDAAAGLKTLPIYLGEKRTRILLQSMHIILHLWIAAAMLMNFIKLELALFLTSMFSGMIYTCFYTRPSPGKEKKLWKILRDMVVDGEFVLAVFLKTLIRI